LAKVLFFFEKNKTSYPLFLWRKEKRQKKHPPSPILPLYGEAQPLLLVAHSLRYAQGIKALAWFPFGLRQYLGANHHETQISESYFLWKPEQL